MLTGLGINPGIVARLRISWPYIVANQYICWTSNRPCIPPFSGMTKTAVRELQLHCRLMCNVWGEHVVMIMASCGRAR